MPALPKERSNAYGLRPLGLHAGSSYAVPVRRSELNGRSSRHIELGRAALIPRSRMALTQNHSPGPGEMLRSLAERSGEG